MSRRRVTVGTISSTGLYTAPLSPPAVGQVTVTAVSQVDSTKSASAKVTPVFSNASITGSYVFKTVTTNGTAFSFAGGVFTSDGNGHLTSGIEDVNASVGGPSTNIAFSGIYNVGPDGRGTATTSSTFGTSTFRFVLFSSTGGELIEFDNTAVTSGFVLRQDVSAISGITGSFVFAFQGEDIGSTSSGPLSSVGQIVFNGTGGASGTQDVNDQGTFLGNVPFSGSYSIGTQGRGIAALTGLSGTSNYAFYIVDANTIEFLNVDPLPGLIESGTAVAQPNASFSNASLGSSAFLLSGGATSGTAFVAAGRFDTDGAGTIQNGVLDENTNGAFVDGLSFSGSYSIASNGRGTASVTTSNGTSTFVFWLGSRGNAQFMESDSFATASGVTLTQRGSPFANSSFQGNFAFALAGASGSLPFSGIGQVSSSGSGTISGTEDFNAGGSTSAGVSLSGMYSIGSNGRGTASVTGLGITPLRLHIISPAEAVFISADPTQPLIGLVEKQCSDCH